MDPEDDLVGMHEKLEAELVKARREHTRLLENIEQFTEQESIYQQHLKDMKAAKICSLREWKESETFLYHTANQLTSDREKLVNVENFIKETDKQFDYVKSQLIHVLEKALNMGKLIRFPAREIMP